MLEKQYSALELFQMGRGQGLSPEFLVFQEGEPLLESSLRNELVNCKAEDILPRLYEILPRLIVEAKNIERASELTQVVLESKECNISARSLLFLCSLRISLRWLLFGVGESVKSDGAILPPQISTDIKYSSALTELKTISQLSACDIVWIFGRNYQVVPANTVLSLSVSMLIRMLEHISIVKFVPQMPDTVIFIEKIENSIENFVENSVDYSENVINAIRKLKMHKSKLCYLFFVNRSTLHTWMNRKSNPRVVISRIMYILSFLIENYGDKGLAAYLEILDAEAKSRGKINFSAVLDSEWDKK